MPIKIAKNATEVNTTIVEVIKSSLVDQDTFFNSVFTSPTNFFIFGIALFCFTPY